MLCEITPFLIEKFKHERIKTPTKNGTVRAPASVNREFETLSRLFSLAIDFKQAESPCSRVRKFKLDNERYRYLMPKEEPVLIGVNRAAGALEGDVYGGSGSGLTQTRATESAA